MVLCDCCDFYDFDSHLHTSLTVDVSVKEAALGNSRCLHLNSLFNKKPAGVLLLAEYKKQEAKLRKPAIEEINKEEANIILATTGSNGGSKKKIIIIIKLSH